MEGGRGPVPLIPGPSVVQLPHRDPLPSAASQHPLGTPGPAAAPRPLPGNPVSSRRRGSAHTWFSLALADLLHSLFAFPDAFDVPRAEPGPCLPAPEGLSGGAGAAGTLLGPQSHRHLPHLPRALASGARGSPPHSACQAAAEVGVPTDEAPGTVSVPGRRPSEDQSGARGCQHGPRCELSVGTGARREPAAGTGGRQAWGLSSVISISASGRPRRRGRTPWAPPDGGERPQMGVSAQLSPLRVQVPAQSIGSGGSRALAGCSPLVLVDAFSTPGSALARLQPNLSPAASPARAVPTLF